MEPVIVENMDFGPCETHFGEIDPVYLGRTQGETTVEYSIETFALETEEDGTVDEIVSEDSLAVTIPLVYTDKGTISTIVPWSEVVKDDSSGDKKLVIPKAVGERLSTYADMLNIHPRSMGDDDLSRDIYIGKCYPKPGPINFAYSRNGVRTANVTFEAMEDSDGNYMTIGDKTISAPVVLVTEQTITSGEEDPILIVYVLNDKFAAEADVEDTLNWTYTDTDSGLTLNTIQRFGDKKVAISFSGTASAETATLECAAAALVGDSASQPMDIVIS